MKRLGLATGIFLLAGLLALGAFSVLADKGGPGHGADHGVATGLQDDGGVGPQQGNGDDGDGANNGEGPRDVKGIPDKSGEVVGAADGEEPNGKPFNLEETQVVVRCSGVEVRVPDQAAENAKEDCPEVGATGQGNGQGHAFGRGHGTGQPEGVPPE